MKRDIINIDEGKCTGCGLCIPGCPEGAIQLIDGVARLVGDLFCDGLGACIGRCPEGAITVEQREAEPYDEVRVLQNIIPQGENTIRAHLEHLKSHSQHDYYQQALELLREEGINIDIEESAQMKAASGCPGARSFTFDKTDGISTQETPSQLTHWPVQLHLLTPGAPHYHQSDLLLAADCTAFAMADFHSRFLRNRTLAIACPKLDEGQTIYLEKLTALIDESRINTITVLIMQVPCCRGLINMVLTAMSRAKRRIPGKGIVLGIKGEVLAEQEFLEYRS